MTIAILQCMVVTETVCGVQQEMAVMRSVVQQRTEQLQQLQSSPRKARPSDDVAVRIVCVLVVSLAALSLVSFGKVGH